MGRDAAIEEVESIMKQVDADGNGYIEYTEFLSASMNQKKLLSANNLDKAFHAFDTDGSGTISVDELKAMLQMT
jgi:Ca2+-binding EF-hand superfamily protein